MVLARVATTGAGGAQSRGRVSDSNWGLNALAVFPLTLHACDSLFLHA